MQYFPFRFNSWIFKPNGKLSLVLLLVLPSLVYLGCWQIHRGQHKQKLATLLSQSTYTTPLPLAHLQNSNTNATLPYRSVYTTGTLLTQYPILLDNQIYQNQVGYQLFIPLQLKPNTLLLVDHGFLKAPVNRAHLPKLPSLPTEPITVTGFITKPSTGFVLKKINPDTSHWPVRVQTLDYDWLTKTLKQTCVPFVLSRHLPKLKPSADQHFAYAGQWFLFAILALGYYIFLSFKRR